MFSRFTDKAIVDGIRLQDDKVLNYLYNHYYTMVRNHVTKNSGTPDDVADVFQETVITIYQKITENNFELTGDLKGFFFGISRNIWSAQLRQKSRTEELIHDIAGEEEEEHEPMFQRIMTRAFNRLKPECQEVLRLFSDGCSYQEIAEKMNYKNEVYARRKKYLCKEELMELIKEDPEYSGYDRFLK